MIISFIFVLIVVVIARDIAVDLTKCKVTHLGSEYIGRVSVTESNATCQFWSASTEKVS